MAQTENIGENGESVQKVDTKTVKCRNCGSNMVFEPSSQMLYCEHCGTKETVEKNLAIHEMDIMAGFQNAEQWDESETVVFRCDNCGAKVVLQKNETAKLCPFCGTAHVTQTDELAGLKPNALIPFSFSVAQAVDFCKNWAKKLLFAPKPFKKSICPDNVKGVYSPCFTFDSNTNSLYNGRIGKRHTRVVGSGKNRRTETYVVWKNISGSYDDFFDDVLITAGKKFGQKELDKLSPFDTNNGCVYEEKYLLGFMAYHYEEELTDCWSVAKTRIDAAIKKSILAQYSYDVVDYLNISTAHSNVTYKYVMLPIYIGNYTYKNKVYNFYVNGSTGKVTGKSPISIFKVGIAVLIGLIVAAGIGLLVYLSDDTSSASLISKFL